MRIIVILCLLISTSLSAQILPQDENEFIKVRGIGAANTAEGFRWTLWYETRTEDIKEIKLYNLTDGKETLIISLKGEKIYEPGYKKSEIIDIARLDWIYEEGTTVRLFRLDIVREESTTTLYVPRTFSESVKKTHRNLIKERLGHEQPLVQVRPYIYLDTRRWTMSDYYSKDEYVIMHYSLDDPPEGPTENVMHAILAPGFDPIGFLEYKENQMLDECQDSTFQMENLGRNMIYFEWSHKGCQEDGPRHVMGVFTRDGEEIYDLRYNYYSNQMPEKNHEVWKAILTKP